MNLDLTYTVNIKLGKGIGPVRIAQGIPEQFGLNQNYPNPFNPETHIQYQLNESGRVRLEIYDLMGRKVRTLVDQDQPAGYFMMKWDGKNQTGNLVPSGMYLYRITVQGMKTLYTANRKMIMLK